MHIKLLQGYPIQILASFIVSIGTFAFGLGHLWVAPAIPKLLVNNGSFIHDTLVQISDSEGSWIASIELLTLPFSSIGTIFLANYFGTRNILILAPMPLIISWLLIYFAQNVWYFYVSRFMVGVSEAFFYNCGPVYIGEISDPTIRGALLFLIPAMFNAGGLLSYYYGYVLSIRLFALLCIIPAIFYFALFIWMPQSPYFLIIKKKYGQAEDVLKLLRGKAYKDGEIQILQDAVELEMKNKVTFNSVINNHSYRLSFGIVLFVMSVQQLCGSTSVASYLHFIINTSEVSLSTDKAALIAGILTVLGSLSSTYFVDRSGRRPLILVSVSAACIFMLVLAVCFSLKENNFLFEFYEIIVYISLALYQFFVSFGIINMSLVLAGELFATNTKNYGVSIALIGYGVFGFLTNKIFLFISSTYGMSFNFFGFSICSFIGCVTFYLYLPETRHKSLIEIQEMLQGKNKSVSKQLDS